MRLSWTGAVAASMLASMAADMTACRALAQSVSGSDSAVLASEGEASAAIFVLDEYLNGDNDLERIASLYGNTVWYFDLGPQPKDAILRDKRAYLARWPQREFTPDLETLEVKRLGGEVYDITVEVDYRVSNQGGAIEGRTLVKVTVERKGDGFVITEEGGRALTRERFPSE